jgi:hypothetical protein
MYPKPVRLYVKEESTLREFIAGIGEDTLYAYDRRVVGVLVNNKRKWDSAIIFPGDEVTIYPIIVGG